MCGCVCVCVRGCVWVRGRVCGHAGVCVCVCACMHVSAKVCSDCVLVCCFATEHLDYVVPLNIPASGGPTVMGREKMAKRKPSACEAPFSPTRSKAMGPSRQMKRPSQSPITRQMTIRISKWEAKGMQAVLIPNNINATCCMCTRLTQLTSAKIPNRMRETPDVTLMHIGSRFPSDPGNMSSVCLTWRENYHVSIIHGS